MSKRTHAVAAVLMAVFLLPGAAELIEDGVHWAIDGHTAHDETTGHHEDSPTDEHGCSGAYHFCTCCTSPQFVASPTLGDPNDADPCIATVVLPIQSPAPSHHLDRLFRPPIA